LARAPPRRWTINCQAAARFSISGNEPRQAAKLAPSVRNAVALGFQNLSPREHGPSALHATVSPATSPTKSTSTGPNIGRPDQTKARCIWSSTRRSARESFLRRRKIHSPRRHSSYNSRCNQNHAFSGPTPRYPANPTRLIETPAGKFFLPSGLHSSRVRRPRAHPGTGD